MTINLSIKKFITREVLVGNIGIGGFNPIRIQSMTTTNTQDIESTVNQTKQLVHSGCEIVRFTVQGLKEAYACEKIKDTLIQQGYNVPLVADIHFFPQAALTVADFVDKVRINPGNFVDKRHLFKNNIIKCFEKQDLEFHEKLEKKFVPLIKKCKKLKKSLRIGVNHGSLSERIMQKYGDTVEGMVISAVEFVKICRKLDFHDIVFSMKSSNPKVMKEAYLSLVEKQKELNWDYPLHLGVTESGSGLDGRVKSAIGIGGLLIEGIGDTIRVSLTEDPTKEIEPCLLLKEIAEKNFHKCQSTTFIKTALKLERTSVSINPKSFFSPRYPIVFLKPSVKEEALLLKNKINFYDLPPDVIISSSLKNNSNFISSIQDHKIHFQEGNFVEVNEDISFWEILFNTSISYAVFKPLTPQKVLATRNFFSWLEKNNIPTPIVLNFNYDNILKEKVTLLASTELGTLLMENLGEAIFVEANNLSIEERLSLSFSILQGTKKRLTKTEFISCPGCGRTLFDLPSVEAAIRKRVSHLPGLKIAIMGCIVNGPGEMADADFGFVGSKSGLVDLYVKHRCIKPNIPMEKAEDELISLLKEYDVWVDPS